MATSKLPTFQEWLEVRDAEMAEGLGKGLLGAGLAGLGLWAGSHFLSNRSSDTPAPTRSPTAAVSTVTPAKKSTTTTAGDQPTMKWQVTPGMTGPDDFKSVTPTPDPEVKEPAAAKPGKTFRMKGGHSGFADIKATIERPAANTWVFHIQGEIKPRDAIKQAKDIVQDELGAKTQSGLSAEFNPTDTGMDVTVHFTPESVRQRMLRGD